MVVDRFKLNIRNVEVFDSCGGVVAGFWQYGTLQWDEFYNHLRTFIVTSTDWSIFQYEPTQQQHGAPCPSGTGIVPEGTYILLSTAGEPIRVGLESLPSPRNPLLSNDPSGEFKYIIRGYVRDRKCLITDTIIPCILKVAHIFPRSHYTEWIRRGYPSKITDTADEASVGGPLKIDSVQNVITLRVDLQTVWEEFQIGVEPNKNYRITSFRNNEEVHGLHLKLDHIQDPNVRPLDEFFNDHFKRCIFKYMRGPSKPDPIPDSYDRDSEDEDETDLQNLLQGRKWDDDAYINGVLKSLEHRLS